MSGSLTQSERELLGRLGRESRSAKKKSPTPRMFKRGRPVSSTLRVKFIQAPEGGIPARVGNLMGHTDCNIYDLGDTSYTIEDTTKQIDVLNWGVEVACATGDRYGWAAWYDGAWWLISEDCADDSQSQSLQFTPGSPDEGDGDTASLSEGSSGAITTINSPELPSDLADFQATSGGLPPTI